MPEIGARKVVSRTSWRALLTESWASRRFASAVGRLTAAPPLAAPVSAPALSALLDEASEPLGPEAPGRRRGLPSRSIPGFFLRGGSLRFAVSSLPVFSSDSSVAVTSPSTVAAEVPSFDISPTNSVVAPPS